MDLDRDRFQSLLELYQLVILGFPWFLFLIRFWPVIGVVVVVIVIAVIVIIVTVIVKKCRKKEVLEPSESSPHLEMRMVRHIESSYNSVIKGETHKCKTMTIRKFDTFPQLLLLVHLPMSVSLIMRKTTSQRKRKNPRFQIQILLQNLGILIITISKLICK